MLNDESQERFDRLSPWLFGLAAFYFLLEWIAPTVGSYKYFIDEFYYLACANHLALGYVDQPPLSIFLLWVVRGVLGDSLLALRFIPALVGGITVLLVGNIARRLGASSLGQILAAAAIVIGLAYQIMFSYYSMNAISILLWAIGLTILVRIEQQNEPRWWLVLGVVIGLGLLNKHSFILFPASLLVGLLLTPARRHLASRWFWFGCAIAALLILPNLIWQIAHGWPSLEFYRNAVIYKNVPTPPGLVLLYQILATNPGALVLWIAGLLNLLLSKDRRSLRYLGWMYLTLLALMMVSQSSRPDRIVGAYIILFAAGGAYLSVLWSRKSLLWLSWALPSIFLITGLALAPLGLPLLPVNATASYAAELGVVPQIEQSEGAEPRLPLWIGYRIGWEEFVDDIETAADQVDSSELGKTIILVPSYGQAGAIELLGRGRHLPPVYATQNSYFHWGPPPDSTRVAIVAGFSEKTVQALFSEAEIVRVYKCDQCIKWMDDQPIWIARDPKVRLRDAWPAMKNYQ